MWPGPPFSTGVLRFMLLLMWKLEQAYFCNDRSRDPPFRGQERSAGTISRGAHKAASTLATSVSTSKDLIGDLYR